MKVVVYLYDADEATCDRLADKVAALVPNGDTISAVITVEPYEWPEDVGDFVKEAEENALSILVPGPRRRWRDRLLRR